MREFKMVHWTAHEKAFKQLTWHQQIHTAKLIHNLANINRQNFLYYKTSPLCPGCDTEEEYIAPYHKLPYILNSSYLTYNSNYVIFKYQHQ
jgi:hypothetical protein